MSGYSLTSSTTDFTPSSSIPTDLHTLLLCLVDNPSKPKECELIRARYYPDIGKCPAGTHRHLLIEAAPLCPVQEYAASPCDVCPRRSESLLYPPKVAIDKQREDIKAHPVPAMAAICDRWKKAREELQLNRDREAARTGIGADERNSNDESQRLAYHESQTWWLYQIAAFGIGRRLVNAKERPSEFHEHYVAFIHDFAANLVKRNELRAGGAHGIPRIWCPKHNNADAHLLPMAGNTKCHTEYMVECGLCPIAREPPKQNTANAKSTPIIHNLGARFAAASLRNKSNNESKMMEE